MTKAGLTDCENCLMGIIVFANNFCKLSHQDSTDLINRLKSHSLFNPAQDWLRFKVISMISGDPSVWVYMATMIILCENASEMCKLIRRITKSPMKALRGDVSEFFYWLALLLLASRRVFRI